MAQDGGRGGLSERMVEDTGAERYPERRRPARRAVMGLFVVLATGVVIVPVLLANNGRNLERLGERLGLPLNDWWRGKTERVALPPQPVPPPEPAGTGEPPRLKIPTPALGNPPSHIEPPAEAWKAEAGCNGLQPGATGEKPVFLAAQDGRSECTVLIALGEGEKASALFLQVRADGDTLTSLRMKLNFGEDDLADALTRKAGDLAQRILAPMSSDDRDYIQGRMTERQAFRTEIGNYRMTFRAEGNDTSRFNFIALSRMTGPAVRGEGQNAPDAADQGAGP